jgi:hypothetical protein
MMLPAGPLAGWLEGLSDEQTAAFSETQHRLSYRVRNESELVHSEAADELLVLVDDGTRLSDLYELETPRDSRGRSLVHRRAPPPRLTYEQVVAAHKLHLEADLSLRELGRLGWESWGYKNADSASRSLSVAFKRHGLKARDKREMTTRANRRRRTRPQCSHVHKHGEKKGTRCTRQSVGDGGTCWRHNPDVMRAHLEHLHEADRLGLYVRSRDREEQGA